MNFEDSDRILDRALEEIRQEEMDEAVVESAAQRVWARMRQAVPGEPAAAETIRTCADFQALIPARVKGQLSGARALLLEDHTRECPACRKALQGARAVKVIALEASGAGGRSRWPGAPKWAAAAGIVLAAGLAVFLARDRILLGPAGSRAVVQAAEGLVQKLAGEAGTAVSQGAALGEGERVRTAKESGAVLRLRDGSLVEMRERTEVSISERRDGARIRLERGGIIVQAARQRSGRLYVATEDCLVSVTGTVFSVNRGLKGSRVSVIEGEVRVAQGAETTILRPGQQISTNPSLSPAPLSEEIAWSRNADSYSALLRELSTLQKKLAALPGPALRYSMRLAELAPEDTVFYASIPNLGPTLGEAQRVLEEQLEQSPALREWWAARTTSAGGEWNIQQALAQIRAFSDYLGPEIVLAISPSSGGEHEAPLVLAEVTRPGFRAYLEAELRKLAPGAPVRVIEEPEREAAGAGNRSQPLLLLRGNVAALAGDLAQLQQLAGRIDRPGSGGFAQTAFYARIAEAYRDGVGWLFCADLQKVMARSMSRATKPARGDPAETFRRMGMDDARYLMLQRKDVGGKTENRALLAFSQARRGVMSWLAAPAPLGALDFVSPEASFVVALVVKEPALMVEDLFGMLEASDTDFWRRLAEFEARSGVDVRADLARPLGGEVVFALDGPLLPQPAWKLVVEVYDPARFQAALERLVETVNRQAQASDQALQTPLRVDGEQSGGRTFYVLRGIKPGLEAYYTFVEGHLLAGPNRALLAAAIQYRESGTTLARSAKLTALLPRDGQPNFSGLVYSQLGALAAPLLGVLRGAGALGGEPGQKLEGAAPAGGPSVILVYGGPEGIELAASGSVFPLSLESLVSFRAGAGRRR